nr:MAG TPA: hypothetical protein [Caudoviricetes sp.]
MINDKIVVYTKDNLLSAVQSFYKNIEPFYKTLEIDINRCAINQRNWRMYIIDLGGNGRHRNIRKAIRLMNSNKNILGDVINAKSKIAMNCRISEYSYQARIH